MLLVSIIIAAHQARSFIADAVRSALIQGVADIEILISPDEPQDATDYSFLAAVDQRVRVLPAVPLSTGPGPARNRALLEARGRFIAVLDADDLWSPDYLARLLPSAERRGAAFGKTRLTDWQGKVVREITATEGEIGFADFATAYGSLHGLARNQPDRRWHDVLAEDVLFDLETLALSDGRVPFVNDAVYTLRLRPHSTTRSAGFINEIAAGYDRLMAMIHAGETFIPPAYQAAASDVFRSWQKMNANFGRANAADPTLDFQSFVASRLLS